MLCTVQHSVGNKPGKETKEGRNEKNKGRTRKEDKEENKRQKNKVTTQEGKKGV
jgi:hypothetical protein